MALPKIRTALVIGTETMGDGVAQVLAINGFNVPLVDSANNQLDKARGWIKDNLNLMV